MQKLVAIAVALLCAFAFTSCNTKERAAKNNATGQAWLGNFTKAASIKIGGGWASLDWGTATFTQTGRNVTGTLGNYAVTGVISGSKVYFLITHDGWVHYTAILEKTPEGALVGYYSDGVPYNAKDQHEMLLKPW